ncbi:MAG: hypothetical protein H6718_36040 [Polyangiaceae bacterium]|nr:hypothetical protein [Polyangiaceae bacterium]
MNVNEARTRRHAPRDETHSEGARSSKPSADQLRQQAEARQSAAQRQPQSPLAARAGKGKTLAATQAFVQKTLASHPERATQLLQQYHLKHESAAVRQLVEQGIARHSGKELYDRGCRLIRELRGFSQEQLKDITGMVKAGTPLGEAIRQERAELKLPVAFVAPKSVKSQAQAPIARAQSLAKRAASERAKIANAWRQLSHITRGAEAYLGGTKALLLVPKAFKEGLATAEKPSTEPFDRFAHDVHVTGQYLTGQVTDLQRRTDVAYLKVVSTLNAIQVAYEEMAGALSKAPPDTLAANAAQKRAESAAKGVDKQVADFRDLASQYAAANKEFDHQVVHTALEVLESAVAAGIGMALGSGSAAHGAGELSRAARVAHVVKEVGEHAAFDGMMAHELEKAKEALGQAHDLAKRALE